jgi:hypothetical protein
MKTYIALLTFLLAACDTGTAPRSDAKELTLGTGSAFAAALVSGNYVQAQSLLSAELQQQYTPENLQARYNEMVAYGTGAVKVDGHTEFMDDWPARRGQDIGWAYISISGDDFAEAVTVVVADENGTPKIRELEWGRP